MLSESRIWGRDGYPHTVRRKEILSLQGVGVQEGGEESYPERSISSVQLLSRVRLFVTPWTASTPGLPVHHQLPEFTQTHVHRVSDAIQPSHPLSSPSPPASNLSQQNIKSVIVK